MNDTIEASYYGSVAASFALEQIGLPEREQQSDETSNEVCAMDRLHAYPETEYSDPSDHHALPTRFK